MSKTSIKILAVLLPVILPLFFMSYTLAVLSNILIHQVKIEGYDPRDMLYGHYLVFRFNEDDMDQKGFDEEQKKMVFNLDRRYYIPEKEARYLERLLRNEEYDMRIGVGFRSNGTAFKEKLYINGQNMEDFLDEFPELTGEYH